VVAANTHEACGPTSTPRSNAVHLVHLQPTDTGTDQRPPARADGQLCPVIPLTAIAEIRMRRVVRSAGGARLDGGNGPDAA
jgi:hypothetical protein